VAEKQAELFGGQTGTGKADLPRVVPNGVSLLAAVSTFRNYWPFLLGESCGV